MSLLNDDSASLAAFPVRRGHKMLSSHRLLIIEDVVLIALDIQRILEEANARQAVFVRNFDEANALADRFGEFDLAIVNPPQLGTHEIGVAAKLAAAGPAILVSTASPFDLSSTPLAGSETLIKPFADGDLLAACQRAIERRKR
jgi:DNA-binding response OmpR family regulator